LKIVQSRSYDGISYSLVPTLLLYDVSIATMHSIPDRQTDDIIMVMAGWRCSVVISTLTSINAVNRHWAWLVLGWVTVCGQVNHLGM